MKSLKKAYLNWKSVTTYSERKVLKQYIHSTFSRVHRKLNGALRNNSGEYSDKIELMHKALSKAEIPQNIILYRDGHRGIFKDNELEGIPYNQLKGKILMEKGFMSTSCKNNALWFKGKVRYIIDVPKGAKGIWVKPLSGWLFWEDEIILDYGQKMKILNVDDSNKKYLVLNVELLVS